MIESRLPAAYLTPGSSSFADFLGQHMTGVVGPLIANGLRNVWVAGVPDQAGDAVLDPPALIGSHQCVVIPARPLPDRATLGVVADEHPVAVRERVGLVAVDGAADE